MQTETDAERQLLGQECRAGRSLELPLLLLQHAETRQAAKWPSGQVAMWPSGSSVVADWPKGGANTKRVVRINYGIKLASGIGATAAAAAAAAASATAMQLQHPRQDLPLPLPDALSLSLSFFQAGFEMHSSSSSLNRGSILS